MKEIYLSLPVLQYSQAQQLPLEYLRVYLGVRSWVKRKFFSVTEHVTKKATGLKVDADFFKSQELWIWRLVLASYWNSFIDEVMLQMLQRLVPSCLLSKGKESLEKLNSWNYDNDCISTKVVPGALSQKRYKNLAEGSLPTVAACILLWAAYGEGNWICSA